MSRKSKRQLSMDERWAAWHLRQANEVPELREKIKRLRRALSKACSMNRYPAAKTFPSGEPEAGYLEYRDLVYYREMLSAPNGHVPAGNIKIGHRTVHSTMVTIQWIDAELRKLVIETSPGVIESLNRQIQEAEAALAKAYIV